MARTKLSETNTDQGPGLRRGLVGSRKERREMRKAVDRKLAGRSLTARQNQLAKQWETANPEQYAILKAKRSADTPS